MPQPVTDWTAEQVRALPDDGNRYEVVDGELLVSPAPSWTHQYAVSALSRRIGSYVDAQGFGVLLFSPADIEFDPHTLVQPDVFVTPLVEGRRPRNWAEIRRLLLAVEVLSPSTARADRRLKRSAYQRHGVPEYWILDLDARLIERWRPEDDRPEVLGERLAWHPVPHVPPLELDLPELFAEVLDR